MSLVTTLSSIIKAITNKVSLIVQLFIEQKYTTMSAESENSRNFEHHAVIKFLVKKGNASKDILEEMSSVFQDSAPSHTMVKKWARIFQQGRESCEDNPHPGRSVTVLTKENVRQMEKIVLAYQRIKLW
ncbi:unnamed protein product [Parnassius mnemosyne]|uniref:Mos1 transposase HTH domain-containing protein n=1 Tax=Parnassius mnemosyne TaxID=213953 RepID=A0AAV1K7Z7_9NEOP